MDWQQLANTLLETPEQKAAIMAAVGYVVMQAYKWLRKRFDKKRVDAAQGAGFTEKRIVALATGAVLGLLATVAEGCEWSQLLPNMLYALIGSSGVHNMLRTDSSKTIKDAITPPGAGLPVILCVVLLTAPACVLADETPAIETAIDTGFGMVEARAYKPIWPDTTLEFGGGLAVQLCVVPEDLLVLGSMLGGHRVFADVAYVRGQCAFGGSVSLRGAAKDDGLRLFGVLWKEDDFEASGGVAYGWKVDLKELF